MKHSLDPGSAIRLRTGAILLSLGLLFLAVLLWRSRPLDVFQSHNSAGGMAAGTQVWFATTPTAGPAELAAPLRVQITLPPALMPTAGAAPLANVRLELRDAAGQPAVFGPGPAPPQEMILFDQPPRWTADLSAPTVPGTYHAQLIISGPDIPTQTLDLPATTLQVVAPVAPWTGGFVYGRDGNLWRTSTDGHHTRKLTFWPRTERADEPAWSPDGHVIVYSHRLSVPASELSVSDIWSVRPDGTDNHQVVAPGVGEDLHYPAWTPDSGRLLITVIRVLDPATGAVLPADQAVRGRDRWTIETVDLASGARRLLVADALMPYRSPDGTRLTYLATPPFNSPPDVVLAHMLMIANADGSNARVLVPSTIYQDMYAPRISPDGRQIVFAAINPEGWAHDPGATSWRRWPHPSRPTACRGIST